MAATRGWLNEANDLMRVYGDGEELRALLVQASAVV